MNHARLWIIAALLLAAGTPVAAGDPSWEIELLPADRTWTVTNPTAISREGWIAGYGGTDYTTIRPVLWREGSYVDLLDEFPGADGYSSGFASDVNEQGWLGGVIANESNAVAVLWDGAAGEAHIVHPQASDVPAYSFTDSQIFGLNDRTEAAGMLRDFSDGFYVSERAYVWGEGGTPGTLLPIPKNYVSSQAVALNNRGTVGGAVWDDPKLFNLTACAWLRRSGGSYEFVHIHTLLADADPKIERSFVTCVDDHGRVYGVGQDAAFRGNWTFVWDRRDGVRLLDRDGSVGQIWGASARVLAGYRGDPFSPDVLALAWIREEPFVLPTLTTHDGHLGVDANTHGDVVGYAMHPGNVVWWQGSDAWIARRR
jgi:hypothetical protein